MEFARHCIVNTIKCCAMKNKLYAILFGSMHSITNSTYNLFFIAQHLIVFTMQCLTNSIAHLSNELVLESITMQQKAYLLICNFSMHKA